MNPEEFSAYRRAGRAFVRSLYQSVWNIKTEVLPLAETQEQALASFLEWSESVAAEGGNIDAKPDIE
jgi:hypothetical protein